MTKESKIMDRYYEYKKTADNYFGGLRNDITDYVELLEKKMLKYFFGGCVFGIILFLFLFFIILTLSGKNIWIH